MSVMWATLNHLRQIHGDALFAIIMIAQALDTQERATNKQTRENAVSLFSTAVKGGIVLQ